MQRFYDKVSPEPNSGCWLWCGTVILDGYGMIQVGSRVDGSRRAVLAHRLSWQLHRGAIPEGLKVLHRCDIPCCVNPDHLFLGTDQDNANDKMRKGRHAAQRGVAVSRWRSGGEKLTEEMVRAIRADKRQQKEIAVAYAISQSNVSMIQRRATWRHI